MTTTAATVAIFIVISIFVAPTDSVYGETCSRKQYESEIPCEAKDYTEFEFSHKCLKFVFHRRSVRRAVEDCGQDEGELLRISSKKEEEDLAEEFRDELDDNDFWIGLGRKNSSTDDFQWINKKNPAIWTNWAKGEPVSNKKADSSTPKDCVMRKEGGWWETADCDSREFFICQIRSGRAPQLPVVKTHFHEAPNMVNFYRPVEFSCRAFVDDTSNLTIKLESSWEEGMKSHFLSPKLDYKDKRYIMDGDRCRLLLSVTLSLDDFFWTGIKPVCCSSSPKWQAPLCSTGKAIVVKYDAMAPILDIFYEKEMRGSEEVFVLKASCKAFVGTNGKMTWLMNSTQDRTTWTIDTEGLVTKEGNFEADVIVSLPKFDKTEKMFGPRVRSGITIVISKSIRGSTLCCIAMDIKDVKEIPHHMLSGSWIRDTIYLPLPPQINVEQHHEDHEDHEDDHHEHLDLYSDRPLQVNCSAFVGTPGVLTWKLYTKLKNHIWTITSKEGILKKNIIPQGVEITYTKDDYDKERGPRINSTLTVLVNSSLDDAFVKCYSYNKEHKDRANKGGVATFQLKFDKSKLEAETIHFAVHEHPQKPILHIGYHVSPDILMAGKMATMTCTTYLDEYGIFSWYFALKKNTYIWCIDDSGKLMSKLPEFARIRTTTRRDPHSNCIVLTVHLELKIRPQMNGSTLSCHGYDARDSIWVQAFSSKNMTLTVHYDPRPGYLAAVYVKRGVGVSVAAILLISILTTILMIIFEKRQRTNELI